MASNQDQAMRAFLQEQVKDVGLNKLEGSSAFQEFLDRFPKGEKCESFHIQTDARMISDFIHVRYEYPLKPRYNLCTVYFQVATGSSILQSIHAILLWPDGASEPEYISVGGTFDSQDGEYRSNFTRWVDFAAGMEQARDAEESEDEEFQLIDRLELGIHRMLEEDEFTLNLRVYSSEERREHIVARADELRVLTQTFIAALILASAHRVAPHALPVYTEAMEIPEMTLYEILKLTKAPSSEDPKERQDQWARLIRLRLYLTSGAPGGSSIFMGIKLVPLMRTEASLPENVRYPTWREIWIATQVTNLKINGRTHGVPLFSRWSYVTHVDEELYDGEPMQRLHRNSEAAVAALEKLELARAVAREGQKSGRPFPLEQLDYYIHAAEEQAEQIALADVGILMVMQDVGHTFGTTPYRKASFIEQLCGSKAESLVFDLAYTCLALHSSLCIHADLHYNNMTIRLLWFKAREPAPVCAVYVTGPDGERDTYVLPRPGCQAYIIDFSRSIISPDQKDAIERHQGVDHAETFFREQAVRMIMALGRYLPDFTRKYERELKGVALARQQELYNVLTAIDYFAIGENLSQLFRDILARPRGTWSVNEKMVEVCNHLKEVAHAELLKGLRTLIPSLVKDRKDVPKYENDTIGREILRKAFGHWLFSRWEPAELEKYVPTSIVNVRAPMRYDYQDPAKLPPWAQPEILMKFSSQKLSDFIRDEGGALVAAESAWAEGDDEVELALSHERMRLSNAPARDASKSWLT